VAKASAALQAAVDNKDTAPAELDQKLSALRDARAKAKTQLSAAQKELKELLTRRQEAVLVNNGMLE
jgi:DNA-binding NarL/FixJ family response regulator